jgi:hypothetical protein
MTNFGAMRSKLIARTIVAEVVPSAGVAPSSANVVCEPSAICVMGLKGYRGGLASGRATAIVSYQQSSQMLSSIRLFCCLMERSSAVELDACGTPGRSTVAPVAVR